MKSKLLKFSVLAASALLIASSFDVNAQNEGASPDEAETQTPDSGKGIFFDKVTVDFVPGISFGYSNFTARDSYPIGDISYGADATFQFIAKEKIFFIPQNYFTEVSLGYSKKGSLAFPMYYTEFKMIPFGYRYQIEDFFICGKMGFYLGFTSSVIRTYNTYFITNQDFGMTVGFGMEYKRFGVSISYGQGFIDVCDSNLKLKNCCLSLNLSYRILTLK